MDSKYIRWFWQSFKNSLRYRRLFRLVSLEHFQEGFHAGGQLSGVRLGVVGFHSKIRNIHAVSQLLDAEGFHTVRCAGIDMEETVADGGETSMSHNISCCTMFLAKIQIALSSKTVMSTRLLYLIFIELFYYLSPNIQCRITFSQIALSSKNPDSTF